MTIPYADLAEMQHWAAEIMHDGPPDFVITAPDGSDYLRRWWIVPRNRVMNVYLHEILGSDDDRGLHDHPFDNSSWVLSGSYIEHTPEGPFVREADSLVHRVATDAHRLEIPEGGRAVSLFVTGPIVREWGFWHEGKWAQWEQFLAEKGARS